MYLYQTLDREIMHGIVYVHQKIWPKYVQALKGIASGKNDMYVTNKENSLRIGTRHKKPESTARMYQGPVEIINL